ncbi:MAG TPA: hypothetical protein VGX25_01565 [Actinophytocola sp.]|uniref:hypothetical protein n=1 Tax=Actinophytocola sp. TaxID=1872138 RepID=UPI002DDDA347|nr:hypothetical protein [Actinophytocola sp.]HEV2778065.1 hypothetical protein [Actinophytocola sp.]
MQHRRTPSNSPPTISGTADGPQIAFVHQRPTLQHALRRPAGSIIAVCAPHVDFDNPDRT